MKRNHLKTIIALLMILILGSCATFPKYKFNIERDRYESRVDTADNFKMKPSLIY